VRPPPPLLIDTVLANCPRPQPVSQVVVSDITEVRNVPYCTLFSGAGEILLLFRRTRLEVSVHEAAGYIALGGRACAKLRNGCSEEW
jgi:hypothetical protein